MGWNDRLPEDPNIPYESQDDRDAYDNWAMYLDLLRAEGSGLSSNNVQPGALDMTVEEVQEADEVLARLRELTAKAEPRKTGFAEPGPQSTNEDQNSRQPAHHQEE